MDNNPELNQRAEEQISQSTIAEVDGQSEGKDASVVAEASETTTDAVVNSVEAATDAANSEAVGAVIAEVEVPPSPHPKTPSAEELLQKMENMVERDQLPDQKEMNRLCRLIENTNLWELQATDTPTDIDAGCDVDDTDDIEDDSMDLLPIDQASDAESTGLPKGVTPEMKERFGSLMAKYRLLSSDAQERERAERQKHLEQKEELLRRLEECLTSTFDPFKLRNEFHNIRNEWKEIGEVPDGKRREILDQYEKLVNSFYEQQKLNKEAQEYDFAHNKKEKESLIRRAQDLLKEEDVRKAFRELQYMHDTWKETGPVAPEYREVMWKEFQELSKAINKRHNEYFVQLHEREAANLQRKVETVDRLEKLVSELPNSRDGWRSYDVMLEEIRKDWNEAGHVPRHMISEIRERYNVAKDEYYRRRRSFMKELSNTIGPKLQRMRELVAEAEALQDSTSWRSTADKLKELQREWTEIAQLGTRVGEAQRLWKAFRKACDTFFNNRNKDLKERKHRLNDNYHAKLDIVTKLEALKAEQTEQTDEQVAELQKEWQRIGLVPNDQKEELVNRYYKAIRALTNHATASVDGTMDGRRRKGNDQHRNPRRDTKQQEGDRRNSPRLDLNKDLTTLTSEQLSDEQAAVRAVLARREEEIRKYQTNILFFSASPDNPMVKHVQQKIDLLQKEIEQLQQRIAEIKAQRKASGSSASH